MPTHRPQYRGDLYCEAFCEYYDVCCIMMRVVCGSDMYCDVCCDACCVWL